MGNKKIKLVISIIPLILCALYISGFISQLLFNFNQWELNGNYIGNGISPALPSTNFTTCLKALFLFPYGIYSLGICIIGITVLMIFILYSGQSGKTEIDNERNFHYSDKGTYGTSGFMSEKEMKKILHISADEKKVKGTILGTKDGKIVSVPVKSRLNRNIAVYGASGSKKSRAFARNMIISCAARGESIIITDPKAELYEDTSMYLKNKGYTVKVFNLVDPQNSDSWNFLREVEGQEILAQMFCDVALKNTFSPNSVKGDFWDKAEMQLLKALVLFVELNVSEENKNFSKVYDLVVYAKEQEMDAIFNTLPSQHPAKGPYMLFRKAPDNVRSSVYIGLGSRLQIFQNKLICNVTDYTDIDLTLPGREKCAYYCITSDQDSTFDFLSSLFLTFLIIKLVRYADKHGKNRELPVPVHILGDELCNIGAIPDLNRKIATIRSRSVSISIIFQNIAMLQNRYPDNQWQEILGNCDISLFLGCTDPLTANFISERSGIATVLTESKAKTLNTMQVTKFTPQYRETSSVGKRRVLEPDEVLRLPIDEALIIIRGQKILKVDKFDYASHPESKKFIYSKASEHIPSWRSNEKQSPDNLSPISTGDFYIDKNIPKGGGLENSRDKSVKGGAVRTKYEHSVDVEKLETKETHDEEFEEIQLFDKDAIMSDYK